MIHEVKQRFARLGLNSKSGKNDNIYQVYLESCCQNKYNIRKEFVIEEMKKEVGVSFLLQSAVFFSFKYHPGKHLQNRGSRGLWDWQVCKVPDLLVGLDRKARDIEGGPDDLQHLHPLCGHIDGGDGLGYHA